MNPTEHDPDPHQPPAEPPLSPQEPAAPAPSPAYDPEAMAQATARAVTQSLADVFGGRRVEQPQQRLTVKQQIAALSPEQRQQIEAAIAQNPLAGSLEIAEMIAREQTQEIMAQARPLIEMSGDSFIENFIAQQVGDPLYRQVSPLFRKSLAHYDRAGMVNRAAAERVADLQMRWDAAAAQVYRSAATSGVRPNAQPPVLPSGSAVGAPAPASPRGRSVIDADPGLQELVARLKGKGLLSDADITDVENSYHEVLI
jgi:hypothetical protein